MTTDTRNPAWLFCGILGLSVLGWFIHTFAPDTVWHLTFFFLIVAATTYSIALFLLKIVRRATLIALGVVIVFILRLMGLRDWYYPLLLVPVLISLEILLQKR